MSKRGAKSPKVVMYSAPWCTICKQARHFFKERGIPYREYNIETNRRARMEFGRMGVRGVPAIMVDGTRINGFSAERFMAAYGGSASRRDAAQRRS